MKQHLRIYVATWNVATGDPTEDLNILLGFSPDTNAKSQLPDIYVLGFQEVNSHPLKMLRDSFFNNNWVLSVSMKLTEKKYIKVGQVRLQGMLLLLFSLNDHLRHIRNVQTQYTRRGLGGMWGNKGAVSIRLTIYGHSICFINSHLAAHEDKLEKRITDYNKIISDHKFVKDTVAILDHDYVFWFGDLNFRVSKDCPDLLPNVANNVNDAIRDDYIDLLEYDELKSVMENNRAFSELIEVLPTFPPTYKFEIGTNRYDERRKPSWTDRILHTDTQKDVAFKVNQLNYYFLPQYKMSDHKPVIAEFTIKGRTTKSERISTDSETITTDRFTESYIEFLSVKDKVWYFGDADLIVEFLPPANIEINPTDWIALFESDFKNLDDYICYEYTSQSSTYESDSNNTIVRFRFPVGCGVKSPGFYKFLYFSQPSPEVRSLMGISECFEVRSTIEDIFGSLCFNFASDASTENVDQILTPDPQSNTSLFHSLMKSINNMHVPGMKFNKIHDLSID